jgi:thiol:disulfide interchange protein DsbA
MRFLQKLIAFATLGLAVAAATAAPANPQEGKDYTLLDKPMQTEPGQKVEVIEFFSYACPHCYALDPALHQWVKKQGDRVSFKRVPASFRPSWTVLQKLYYALEAMGKLEELHPKVFGAIHEQRQRLETDAAVTDFVVKYGIDRAKFLEAYNSFGVQTKVNRAMQLQEAMQVNSVPLVIVGGRYVTSPAQVGSTMGQQPEHILHAGMLQVTDWLVNKSAPVAKPAAAAPAAKLAAPAAKPAAPAKKQDKAKADAK